MANHASAQDISVDGVRLSTRYAEFTRGKVTDNERDSPGLGFTIAYHGGEKGKSTVYIYDKGVRGIPDGPMSQLVRDEFDQTTRDVGAVEGYLPGTRVELVGRYGTGTPDRGPEFLCAEFILTDASGSRRTFVYLTGASGRFVKLRVTLRTNDAADPTARNFANALASQLWCKVSQ